MVAIPGDANAACSCGARWFYVGAFATVRTMIDHWRCGHTVVCRRHLTPTIRVIATTIAQGATSATFVSSAGNRPVW